MKKSVKTIIALVVVSCLTSFLSSSQKPEQTPQQNKTPPEHHYDKLKCDSLEIEHRIQAINQILEKQ